MFKGILQPIILATFCESCAQMPKASPGFCAGCCKPGRGQLAFWCDACRKNQEGEPAIRYCSRCGKQHATPKALKDLGKLPEGKAIKSRIRKTMWMVQGIVAILMALVVAIFFFKP